MKLSHIVELFHCKVYTEDIYDANKDIHHAFCADLMSDALMILSTVQDTTLLEQAVLVTGLATNQSIRTAEMLDVRVILLVRGKVPAGQVIELASESGVILLGTETTMFNASGMLYQEGIRGITSQR